MSEATRKRSRIAYDHHHANVHNASLDIIKKPMASSSTSTSMSQNHTVQQLSFEISNLKTELSNLRSLSNMDNMKSESKEKSLKRYILSLEEDVKSANALAEEIRGESENALEEMNAARRKAANDANDWQQSYMELEEKGFGMDSSSNTEKLNIVEKEKEHLLQKIQSQDEEINSLRLQCSRLATTQPNNCDERDEQSEMEGADADKTPLSPAPPAVLSELYRTRVKKAEFERLNRQLSNKNGELQEKADQLVFYRETAQQAESKVEKLERELTKVRREREKHQLVESRWCQFRGELMNQKFAHGVSQTDNRRQSFDSRSDDENVPPEIARVLRHIRLLNSKVEELEGDNTKKYQQVESSQRRLQVLEKKIEEQKVELKELHDRNSNLWDKSKQVELELKSIKAQESIWKRENSSMVALLETYEKMEQNLSPQKKGATKTSNLQPSPIVDGKQSKSALQICLNSANEKLKLLQSQYEAMKDEKSKLEKEKETSSAEYERVKKKFEQLREALYKEREKAEEAEQRATTAETLAGKGSFNLETTRALHLEKNPTSVALREKYRKEIKELKEALEESMIKLEDAGKGQARGKGQISALDAQKLHKRLKESFRAQIAHFREGVYLLTGYKIDMVSEGDRPKFKVRSMYSEKESDCLEFIWPELEEGKSPVSLDMLNTKMGEVLSKDPSFKYVEEYGSLPAFMASVCLSLFETQTMI